MKKKKLPKWFVWGMFAVGAFVVLHNTPEKFYGSMALSLLVIPASKPALRFWKIRNAPHNIFVQLIMGITMILLALLPFLLLMCSILALPHL